jgi:hypothetical protein
MARRLILRAAIAACLAFPLSAFGLVGAGLHWGFDLSLELEDVGEYPIGVGEFMPDGFLTSFPDISGDSIGGVPIDTITGLLTSTAAENVPTPIMLSRTGWTRTIINFGGKVYIDIIPVLDAIEISMNFGVWEYDAFLRYPTGIKQDASVNPDALRDKSPEEIYESFLAYDTLPMTIEEFSDIPGFFGVSKTPYGKIQLDATVRKNIIKLPGKILRIYAGGGPSVHFATPVLSTGFVKKVLEESLTQAVDNANNINALMQDDEQMKKVVTELIESFNVPRFGMHVVVGTMIKLPVIPLGFYGDAKLMIPFGSMDDDVQLNGFGPLFNIGVSLGL